MANFDPKNPTVLPQQATGPYVHPALGSSPEALAYAAGMAARARQREGALNKYTEQLPGAAPAMPPLDAKHVEGMTIADQAALHGATHAQRAQQAAGVPGSIVAGGGPGIVPMQQGGRNQAPTAAQLGLHNTDMLPPEAQRDPQYIQGQGANYAVNQPVLAAKYGVVRNGRLVPPQELRPAGGGAEGGIRRPVSQTLQDIQKLAGVQPQAPAVHNTEEEAVKAAESSAAALSQKAGAPPVMEEEQAESLRAHAKAVIDKMDDFDYESFRKQLLRDQINNPQQREIIEARLEPLSLDELIMYDRVSQRVPIIPGKFEVTFQSMTGDDDMTLKRLLMLESNKAEVTDRYLLDKYALMSLTAGILKIGNNPAPTHLNDKGVFDEAAFWKKFEWVLRRPLHMLAALGCNHTWFEIRVRKLFVAEKVKNG